MYTESCWTILHHAVQLLENIHLTCTIQCTILYKIVLLPLYSVYIRVIVLSICLSEAIQCVVKNDKTAESKLKHRYRQGDIPTMTEKAVQSQMHFYHCTVYIQYILGLYCILSFLFVCDFAAVTLTFPFGINKVLYLSYVWIGGLIFNPMSKGNKCVWICTPCTTSIDPQLFLNLMS